MLFPLIKKIISHPAITIIARLVLGGILIYASWDKILDPAGFAKAVQNYRFLPVETVNLFALVIPWLELVCGLLLIFGMFTKGSSFVVVLLLLSFIVASSAALARGLDIGCGCFSNSGADPITYWYLLREVILVLLSLQIFRYDRGALSLDRVLRRKNTGTLDA